MKCPNCKDKISSNQSSLEANFCHCKKCGTIIYLPKIWEVKKEMEEMLAPILFMILIGGLSGYFAGKLVKRASGMVLTIGIIIAALLILTYTGTLCVDMELITTNLANFFNVLSTLGIITLISSVPFVASFITGIFIGFRRY